jgi:hypothetical protein
MKRALLILAMATATGCGGTPLDVAKAVQVNVASSGWLAAGTIDGKNKIVPAVTLTLKNVSADTLEALQVNVGFRLVSTNDEIGSDFRSASPSGGLPPGASTDKLMLKANRGYTGTDPFEDLLTNSHFVDAKVEVFVKAGPGPWTKVSESPVAREFTGS